MSENVHDGHRARMRDRAMHNGMKSFADHELLEMLLFQAIPRANTNTIAHALIERFGSLKGVLDADAMALKGVKGIGDAAICVLKLNAEIMRRYLTSEVPKENVFDTTGKIAEYLFPEFLNTDREHFYMMRFNNKLNLIGCDLISVGMVNCAEVQMRRITELLIHSNASSILLAHNHPGGLAVPSQSDKDITLKIREHVENIGVHFLDHLVFSDSGFCSIMREEYGNYRFSPVTKRIDVPFFDRFYSENRESAFSYSSLPGKNLL